MSDEPQDEDRKDDEPFKSNALNAGAQTTPVELGFTSTPEERAKRRLDEELAKILGGAKDDPE